MQTANGDREPNKLHQQFYIAVISLAGLSALTILSIYTLSKKKDMVNARGDILFYLMLGCHVISILIPNLITVSAVYSSSMYMCYPKFCYLILYHGLYDILGVLFLMRSLLMSLKSHSSNLTNLRPIFVCFAFMLVGINFFISGLSTGTLPPTEFYYINYCTMPYINNYSVNPKDFYFGIIFFLSIFLMRNIKIWGIKEEMISIFVIHLVYMIVKANNKITNPKCYISSESTENGYRLFLMFLNCVAFFWIYDDKKDIYRSVSNTEVYQIKMWNSETYYRFVKFLENEKEEQLLVFVRNLMKTTKNIYEIFDTENGKI
jgi:hypothetical protein